MVVNRHYPLPPYNCSLVLTLEWEYIVFLFPLCVYVSCLVGSVRFWALLFDCNCLHAVLCVLICINALHDLIWPHWFCLAAYILLMCKLVVLIYSIWSCSSYCICWWFVLFRCRYFRLNKCVCKNLLCIRVFVLFHHALW